MDRDRAQSLLDAERVELERLLAETQAFGLEDREGANEPGDMSDSAPSLTAEGTDDALVAGLLARLDAIVRAQARLDAGTFGRSIRSGLPIPDERLEADPAAELTVDEAETSN